jgi:hypothetical protein
MKKLVSATLVLAIFAGIAITSSCKKEDINVILSLTDKRVCLTATPNIRYQEEDFDVLRTDVESAFSSAGASFDLDKIQEIKFLEANAALETSGNFDDISNVEVYIRPFGASGDGEQIAYGSAGNGVSTLTLQFNGTDLAALFKANDHLVLKVKVLNKAGGNAAKCVKLVGSKFTIRVKA